MKKLIVLCFVLLVILIPALSSVNYFFSLLTIKTPDLLTHSPEGE